MTATDTEFSLGFDSLLDDAQIFSTMRRENYPAFVTKTIQLLARNSGLHLRFAHNVSESHFSPKEKVVCVPPPPAYPVKPSKKEKDQFIQALCEWRGVLNHEVGHAQYTLWRAKKGMVRLDDSNQTYPLDNHKYVDLLENARMERVACENYPGMHKDLKYLEQVLGRIISEQIKEAGEGEMLDLACLFYGVRMAIHNYDLPFKMPDHLKDDWKGCMEFVKESQETNDERDTILIAIRLQQYLEEKEKAAEEKAKEAAEVTGKAQKKLKMKREEFEELKEKLEELNREKEEMKKDLHEKKEGDEEGEETEAVIKIEVEITDAEEGAEKAKDEVKKAEKEVEKAKESQDKAEKQASCKLDDLEDIDPVEKFEEDVEEFNTRIDAFGDDVVPLPLHDYVKNINVEPNGDKAKTKRVLDNVMGQLSALSQRFVQKVRSSRHVGSRTYQGRISTKRLHKYRHSQNIFKTDLLRKKHTAAVSIIIDCSGSMDNAKIRTARRAALVIGEMMYRAKINFTLNGFTIPYVGGWGKGGSSSRFDFGCFTRKDYLIHYRFGSSKDWDKSKHAVLNGRLKHDLQDNDDGESLRHFADELSHEKEERKIMIVLSDGAPCAGAQTGDMDEDLKRVIKEIRQSGTEIYAIGLGTYTSHYYGEQNSVDLSSNAKDSEIITALTKFVSLIANG